MARPGLTTTNTQDAPPRQIQVRNKTNDRIHHHQSNRMAQLRLEIELACRALITDVPAWTLAVCVALGIPVIQRFSRSDKNDKPN
jgi:hypothetical protein